MRISILLSLVSFESGVTALPVKGLHAALAKGLPAKGCCSGDIGNIGMLKIVQVRSSVRNQIVVSHSTVF